MIRLIIRKELTEFFRSAAQRWLFAGVAALLALALYNGWAYYSTHQALTRYSQQLTYQQFVKQGDKNPHIGAHFGFYAFRPTAPLALIESGVDDFTGSSFYLEPHKRGEVKFKEANDATGLRRFGFLNIGYFSEFLLPLFIFLLCYNIFAKEWEQRTIQLLLSTRVRPRQLYLGKLLTCLGLVGVIILLVSGVSLLILGMQNPAAEFRALLPSFGLYVVGLLLFSALITLLGVSVSVLARNSSFALIVLASFWLVGVFLVPRLAGEVSRHTYPAVSSAAFDARTDSLKYYGVGQEGSRDQRREQLLARTLRTYHVGRRAELPVSFIPISIEFFELADAQVMNRAYAQVDSTFARENQLVRLASVVSPFVAFRDLSMALAATDAGSHQEFARQAEIHRIRIQDIVDNFYTKNSVAGEAFWRQVPQFAYAPLGLGARLAGARLALLTLSGWLALALALMAYAHHRITAA